MSKDGHNIEDQFREGLQNYEVVPPMRVWQNMVDDLPEPMPFYQTAQFLYTVATAVVVLLGGIIGYALLPDGAKPPPKEEAQKVQSAEPAIIHTSTVSESSFYNEGDNEATTVVKKISSKGEGIAKPKEQPIIPPNDFAFEATDRGKPMAEPKPSKRGKKAVAKPKSVPSNVIRPKSSTIDNQQVKRRDRQYNPVVIRTAVDKRANVIELPKKSLFVPVAAPVPKKVKEEEVHKSEPQLAIEQQPNVTNNVKAAPPKVVEKTPLPAKIEKTVVVEPTTPAIVKEEAKTIRTPEKDTSVVKVAVPVPAIDKKDSMPIDELVPAAPIPAVVKIKATTNEVISPVSKIKEERVVPPTKPTVPKPVVVGSEAETPLRLSQEDLLATLEVEKEEAKDKKPSLPSTVLARKVKKIAVPIPLPMIASNGRLTFDKIEAVKKPEKKIDFLGQKKEKIAKTKGLSFGFFGSVNNTSLWSSQASDANVNGSLSPNLDFGTSYGLALSYDFTPNYGIQLEWIIDSKQGQKYYNFRPQNNARMRHNYTDINLRYTHFPVLFKYKFNRYSDLTKQPSVINYLVGFQYGWLKSAEINMDNPVIQNDLLQKNSFGFVLGMDYDLYLTKNYLFSVGARSSLSTNSNSLVSLPFGQKTKNLLFGIKAGLTYRFGK